MADQFKSDDYRLRCAVIDFLEAELLARIPDHPITLKINGQEIDIDDIKYTDEGIEVSAVYHYAPGFSKDDIQSNPEAFDPADHSALFTDEEKINLSQSMRT